eukprot:3900968-Pyramimonas_sp.AAC.1
MSSVCDMHTVSSPQHEAREFFTGVICGRDVRGGRGSGLCSPTAPEWCSAFQKFTGKFYLAMSRKRLVLTSGREFARAVLLRHASREQCGRSRQPKSPN